MAVAIRMQRAGGRNAPFYRIVACDPRRARDGRFIEKIGYYDPLKQPAEIHLDIERIRDWIAKGAKVSEAVAILLKKHPSTAAGEADSK